MVMASYNKFSNNILKESFDLKLNFIIPKEAINRRAK